MSPIRATERDRYPRDWTAISQRIRFERAGGRCECDGRCGSWHCPAHVAFTVGIEHARQIDPDAPARCTARHGQPHPATGSIVVLTTAHLDHTPEHCDDGNLLALCQACHLSYDRDHHAQTVRTARAAFLASQMDPLFDASSEVAKQEVAR